jgi:hypothetical protein
VEGVPEVGARDVLLAVLGGHGLDGRGRVRDEIEVDGEVGLADGEKLAQRPGLDSDPLGPHLRDDLFGPVITEAQINGLFRRIRGRSKSDRALCDGQWETERVRRGEGG